MKVSLNNSLQALKTPAFSGYELKKDEYGELYYSTSFPFDPNRYNCYWEAYPVVPDRNGNYDRNSFNRKFKNIYTGEESVKINPGENKIYLDSDFDRVAGTPFAYHFKLVPRANENAVPMYMVDAGDLIDIRAEAHDGEKIFNLVVPNSNGSGKAGAAILIGADNFDARYRYDKNGNIEENPNAENDLNIYKNFANHIGGSLAGVHKALNDGMLDPYDRIFLLPHTSGDKTSAAGYWLESGFQLSSAVDNIDNFNKFQKDLFIKGKTLVADSALTSEGMSGIHIQSILEHGEEDVFFDWFKASSLKNMTAKIGAFGAKTRYIRHKLINAPENPVQDTNGHVSWVVNKEYKKEQPTLIQVYNVEAASPEQIANPNLKIDKYGNPNGEHPLKYGTHNDIGITYNFPIKKFQTYKDSVKRFNEYNKNLTKNGKPYIPLESYMATRMLTKFEGWEFENKIDGGFYTWDANVDIAKFDYADSNEDTLEAMNLPLEERHAFFDKKSQKRCEVLDYAVSSVKYWTKQTKQELNLYVAQTLKNVSPTNATSANTLIRKKIDEGKLPEKINEEVNAKVVENVINDDYLLHGKDSVYNFHDTVLSGLMDFPLESVEVGKDILALFSTPYITNRATKPDQIGKSRFELLLKGNPHVTEQYEGIYNLTTNMYMDPMYKFALEVIEDINKKLPNGLKLNKNGDTSEYGKYVIPIITQEIAKFAVVKGLFPDIKYEINPERGGISYDYKSLANKSLKGLDIYNTSQRSEAEELVLKLRAGIKNISDEDRKKLTKAVYKMIEGTNLKSFELAEMIVDRTKSGMDWRIDAAKDFSNMDGLRNDADTFEDNWNRVIGILGAMVNGIRSVDPNRYVVAEITNEVDLYKLGEGAHSDRFVWEKGKDSNGNYYYRNDIIKKLIRESGIDAVANYANYFSNIAAIFGKKGDDGQDWGENQDMRMYNIFAKSTNDAEEEFLYSGPYDSIVKSYTFVDNHDKPRINHVLSLDMGLFYADLNMLPNDVDKMSLSDHDKYLLKEKIKDYKRRAYNVLHPNNQFGEYNGTVHNYDFSYVSPMAVARGESLKSAFYRAINTLSSRKDSHNRDFIPHDKKDKLFNDIQDIIADMAAGKYQGIYYEPDNFGIEEIHKLIELILKDYFDKNKSAGQEFKEAFFTETFKQALDPAMNNSLGMDKFLVNAPGIPTIYAGDDKGSSGYEKMTKNSHNKNRSGVRHDFIEKYNFIEERQKQKEAVTWLRSRPVLHALNDGAPFLLKPQDTYFKDTRKTSAPPKVTALLRYAADGNTVISLFNVSGVTHTYDKYTDPMNNAIGLAGAKIDLSYRDDFTGLHSGLTPGMEFINAFNPDDKYYVFNDGGDDNYYLAHKDKSEIVLTDNTLTLYSASNSLKEKDEAFMKMLKKRSEKKKNVSFSGGTFVNQIYNVAPVAYIAKNNTDIKTGSKLELVR